MDPVEQFERWIERRLTEGAEVAGRDFLSIKQELAKKGGLRSGRQIVLLVEAIKRHLADATDWTFSEIERQPGSVTIHREVSLPGAKRALDSFLERIIEMSGLLKVSQWAPQSAAQEASGRLDAVRLTLDGDVQDFAAGFWTPRRALEGAGVSNTNNIVNVHAPVQGSIQQAGAGATQHAEHEFSAVAVEAALNALEQAIEAHGAPAGIRDELLAEIATIRPQLGKSAPNWSIVQAAAQGLAAVSLGVAGNLLTPYVQTVLQTVGLS